MVAQAGGAKFVVDKVHVLRFRDDESYGTKIPHGAIALKPADSRSRELTDVAFEDLADLGSTRYLRRLATRRHLALPDLFRILRKLE